MNSNDLVNTPICYLSGPIESVLDGGVNWRREVTPLLEKLGIMVIDPTDKILDENVGEEKDKLKVLKEDGNWAEFMGIMKKIIRWDCRAVDKSDMLFVYLPEPLTHICGTMHEIVLGSIEKKNIYLILDTGEMSDLNSWLLGIVGPKNIFRDFKSVIEKIKEDFEL